MSKFDFAIEVLEHNLSELQDELTYASRNSDSYFVRKKARLESDIKCLELAIKRLRQKVVHTGQFVGLQLNDFYCNGFFGREYDLEGAIIIESGQDYIVVRTTEGIIRTGYFEDGWQKEEMEELIMEWVEGREEE